MGRDVFDDITLHIAADHADIFLPFNLEVEQGRQEAACFQALGQVRCS